MRKQEKKKNNENLHRKLFNGKFNSVYQTL
jgi:hypothetical protein